MSTGSEAALVLISFVFLEVTGFRPDLKACPVRSALSTVNEQPQRFQINIGRKKGAQRRHYILLGSAANDQF